MSGLLAIIVAGCSSANAAKDHGEQLYANCLQCHMKDGSGSALAQAPAIAGLDSAYVEAALVKFRAGVRGAVTNKPSPETAGTH